MKVITTILSSLLLCLTTWGQELNPDLFKVVNLNYPGLEQVKELHEQGQEVEAAAALLAYYRARTGIVHPDIDMEKTKISEQDMKIADDGLKHIFYAHKGYQPSYFYGEDIDWTYWPVKDNELRWQLHRHKWWNCMADAYKVTGDGKYAKEWVFQYMDWIRKNPYFDTKSDPNRKKHMAADLSDPFRENAIYAWRSLEVSLRLGSQIRQFMFFKHSPDFTPEFLSQFLVNYARHGDHVYRNYSHGNNHLLFEAVKMIYAGVFFPELKDAPNWKKSGIDKLNKEIGVQVHDDGMHFELDFHYHMECINIFFDACYLASLNGFANAFPKSYVDKVEKMIDVMMNCFYPDYGNPMFSDAKMDNTGDKIRSYRRWSALFKDNQAILWFATQGKQGAPPANMSKAFTSSGFYVLRNAWESNATQMVLKAGLPGYWHAQPDRGTFELWIHGRNFFPDSGSYIYGGDEEVWRQRNWFRQTMVHNTLTLDKADMEKGKCKLLHWSTGENLDILSYENPAYQKLNHRRTVFFVDQKFFVIIDQAVGRATGNVAIHYNLCEGNVAMDTKKFTAVTSFDDKNNIVIRSFGPENMKMEEQEGWVSFAYRKRSPRTAYALSAGKTGHDPVRFVTVIYPVETASVAPAIEIGQEGLQASNKQVLVKVSVEDKQYNLKCKW